ncbi:MAG TPA: FxsB family cyclophane-forming radical SAM/SPASM peptide maturase, partial [Mycobacterium sp.]|nr:FxsB family cyclophane-forming radical SAM/SPASM peptide maturase [Mycobacterium sp.]
MACDHCYVYEHADQSWRGRPKFMTTATVRAAAGRIADHAASHHLRRVLVVLHGGEPLLLGVARLRATLEILRDRIEPVTRLDLRMQTNGVLLSEAMCDLLASFEVKVGVSLDGDREANDRHRRFANGASSYNQVLSALALLRRPEYHHLYAGILCTVDVRNDPNRVYAALAAQSPPRIDFLLPHATWDSPPLRPGPDPTPYSTWLLKIHDLWTSQGRPMSVRLFESLQSTAEGGPSQSEWVGLDPVDLAVIETDGAWEQVDSLKTAFDGAPATGFDVFADPVDTVATWPGIARRQSGIDDLCDTCRSCP